MGETGSAIVSVIPVEAEASVQYMAGWDYPWAKELYQHVPGQPRRG